MTNVPTDLLRTFVSVVELRSFTRAAKAQGMTQPAVSAQIRRLQSLLGVELLDKSAPGVTLTPMGEHVIDFARHLLSVNDHIVRIASPNAAALVRLGIPGDCMGSELARALAAIRARWPRLRYEVQNGGHRKLFQRLKQAELDVVLALTGDEPGAEARHYWMEELAWVRGPSMTIDADAPVPLVSYQELCLPYRVAVTTLEKIGRSGELVFRANNAEGLRSAVAAGVGVMVAPTSRIPAELDIWEDGPLPLPTVFSAVFVREGAGSELLNQLADHLAEVWQPAQPERVRRRSA